MARLVLLFALLALVATSVVVEGKKKKGGKHRTPFKKLFHEAVCKASVNGHMDEMFETASGMTNGKATPEDMFHIFMKKKCPNTNIEEVEEADLDAEEEMQEDVGGMAPAPEKASRSNIRTIDGAEEEDKWTKLAESVGDKAMRGAFVYRRYKPKNSGSKLAKKKGEMESHMYIGEVFVGESEESAIQVDRFLLMDTCGPEAELYEDHLKQIMEDNENELFRSAKGKDIPECRLFLKGVPISKEDRRPIACCLKTGQCMWQAECPETKQMKQMVMALDIHGKHTKPIADEKCGNTKFHGIVPALIGDITEMVDVENMMSHDEDQDPIQVDGTTNVPEQNVAFRAAPDNKCRSIKMRHVWDDRNADKMNLDDVKFFILVLKAMAKASMCLEIQTSLTKFTQLGVPFNTLFKTDPTDLTKTLYDFRDYVRQQGWMNGQNRVGGVSNVQWMTPMDTSGGKNSLKGKAFVGQMCQPQGVGVNTFAGLSIARPEVAVMGAQVMLHEMLHNGNCQHTSCSDATCNGCPRANAAEPMIMCPWGSGHAKFIADSTLSSFQLYAKSGQGKCIKTMTNTFKKPWKQDYALPKPQPPPPGQQKKCGSADAYKLACKYPQKGFCSHCKKQAEGEWGCGYNPFNPAQKGVCTPPRSMQDCSANAAMCPREAPCRGVTMTKNGVKTPAKLCI